MLHKILVFLGLAAALLIAPPANADARSLAGEGGTHAAAGEGERSPIALDPQLGVVVEDRVDLLHCGERSGVSVAAQPVTMIRA